jgi:putative oxidoreductase
MSLGLLVIRVVVGLMMAAHGSQKLFGWFGGYGLAGTGGSFEGLGYRPGRLFAAAAGASELFGGLLLVLGLLGPVGPALVLAVMIVAAVTVHWSNGLFAAANGIELPLLYAAVGAGLAVSGPGQYSIDTMLALSNAWTLDVNLAVLALGVLAGAVNVVIRRPAPRAPPAPQYS